MNFNDDLFTVILLLNLQVIYLLVKFTVDLQRTSNGKLDIKLNRTHEKSLKDLFV